MRLDRAIRICEEEPSFEGGVRRDCWNDGLMVIVNGKMEFCVEDILADDWQPYRYMDERWMTPDEFTAAIKADEPMSVLETTKPR